METTPDDLLEGPRAISARYPRFRAKERARETPIPLHVRVVVYEPGGPAHILDVPNTVGTFQSIIGGFFEDFYDAAAGAHVCCCVDGFSLGLERNRRFGRYDVVGTAVFAKRDEHGNTVSLDDDDVTRIVALYG